MKAPNGPLREKVGLVGCVFINPVPIAREAVLLAVARGLQSVEGTMQPATLDVEKQIVFHMLEAAKGFMALIHEAPEEVELTDWVMARDLLLKWCESMLPPSPDYGGENIVPISSHPRFRIAG